MINNHTKFPLNWIRTRNSKLKLLDTAVTLIYNQGHGQWFEWIKLNKSCHHAKFDIYHTFSVQENLNVLATYRQSASLTLIITYSHFSCESKITLNMMFYNRMKTAECKTCTSVFIFNPWCHNNISFGVHVSTTWCIPISLCGKNSSIFIISLTNFDAL